MTWITKTVIRILLLVAEIIAGEEIIRTSTGKPDEIERVSLASQVRNLANHISVAADKETA